MEIIPAGYTSKLQVLDVGINKPFKDNMCNLFREFQVNNVENNKITREIVATWINMAWSIITKEMIMNTWRHVGI